MRYHSPAFLLLFTGLLSACQTSSPYYPGALPSREILPNIEVNKTPTMPVGANLQQYGEGLSNANALSGTLKGKSLVGDDLRSFLIGHAHEFEFPDPQGFRSIYYYYRADGRFIYVDTAGNIEADGKSGDHWRVDGNRLCILSHKISSAENCYTIAQRSDGRIQYAINDKRSSRDGWLAMVTSAEYAGFPPLEKMNAVLWITDAHGAYIGATDLREIAGTFTCPVQLHFAADLLLYSVPASIQLELDTGKTIAPATASPLSSVNDRKPYKQRIDGAIVFSSSIKTTAKIRMLAPSNFYAPAYAITINCR
jgi:hypothetical protein